MWPFTPSYPELHPADVGSPSIFDDESQGSAVYDYIVVGGGTAGAVVASRLSEDSSTRVLLIERGSALNTWASRVPAISSNYVTDGSPAYRFDSAPLEYADGRTTEMAGGKALGGTTRINGLMYTRSSAADFNRWRDSGRQGWGYDEVEPFFIKSEGFQGKTASEHHGVKGPWKTRGWDNIYLPAIAKTVEAAKCLGIPLVDDINTPDAPAVACARLHVTLDENSRRCSTFDAFLPLGIALARKGHLKICTQSIVTRLRIQDSRAVGVFFEKEEEGLERQFYARARREVVVCCGAIGSPQLLMLSGIGPASHLQSLGIDVMKDLPGVGSNLQDHPAIPTTYRIPLADSMHVLLDRPLRAIQEFLKYLLWGEGLLLNPNQISIYVRSALLEPDMSTRSATSAELDATLPANIPDIEIQPIAFNLSDVKVAPGTGVLTILGILLQPKSHGTVRLVSRDPLVGPKCDLAFMADPADRARLRTAVKLCKRFGEAMRAAGYPLEDETVVASDSEAGLDAFVNTHVRTAFHYSSTCRMAPEDDVRPGVVDDRLRVHGVRGLRVADCSIFPDVVSNHTQAPAVMVAEKCAHMMLEDARHS
ncbi:alcohol oxidase [Mycena latifolia]|nr:alcohol oxidase [Mycena latifolia]